MEALIGYTGFVGSNLKLQHAFDDLYNSKNISKLSGKEYDLVVCSAIPASMWLSNLQPQKDLQNIQNLLSVFQRKKIKRFVLISSIAVYKQPLSGFDENSTDAFEDILAYGKNRRFAEKYIEDGFEKFHIIRLPALFGQNLKKNFIFDLLNPEPAFLKEQNFNALINESKYSNSEILKLFRKSYTYDSKKGIYEYDRFCLSISEKEKLVSYLREYQSTSLQFTHSQSKFQFYNLNYLWQDIQACIKNDINYLNVTSEPFTAQQIAAQVFQTELPENCAHQYFYDMKSLHSGYWGHNNGYLYSKLQVIDDLKYFKKVNKGTLY